MKLSEALIFRELNKARDAAEKYFSLDNSLGYDFAVSSLNMFCKRLWVYDYPMSAFSFSLYCIFNSTNICVSSATTPIYSYSGLVSFWLAREMNADKKQSKKWIKRGVGCKHWLRSCPCQHLHGTFRTVSAEIASYLSQYIFRRYTYIWSSLFFNLTAATTTTFTVHRGLSSPSRRAIL